MKISKLIFLGLIFSLLYSCGSGSSDNSADGPKPAPKSMIPDEVDPMDNIGVGPITEAISLPETIDDAMVAEGKEVYEAMCTACHKADKKFVGPAPAGIMERRNPTWIMNMILDPEKMVKEDPLAKKLLIEYNGAPMANQGLTEEQARAILEYFRTL
ncbi:MAG: cytochrome c [Bacteroidetes bacterium]|nr:MAG: cytochrome c [Bacteroidota bacterium]